MSEKAFEIVVSHWPHSRSFTLAENAGAARYKAYFGLHEAGYHKARFDDIRIRRAPHLDSCQHLRQYCENVRRGCIDWFYLTALQKSQSEVKS